ncbi:uncharacterized protein B0H18DRAFT_274679 [Fomitopsis serialis]|uniref:uncharacterized protein n=1 Tax=Fomitopsis serialis TaxID=139415 RepID=UPI0020076577|nr:uncharacterized protein B0H18DRAFT_274679 [Neoantrodia serialis]KAH9927841.1 hypothetical protein B0H18DRAFT_274679 [Neoantrodia serialis]
MSYGIILKEYQHGTSAHLCSWDHFKPPSHVGRIRGPCCFVLAHVQLPHPFLPPCHHSTERTSRPRPWLAPYAVVFRTSFAFSYTPLRPLCLDCPLMEALIGVHSRAVIKPFRIRTTDHRDSTMSTEPQRHATRRGSALGVSWWSVSPVVAPGRGCSGRGSWIHQPGHGRGGRFVHVPDFTAAASLTSLRRPCSPSRCAQWSSMLDSISMSPTGKRCQRLYLLSPAICLSTFTFAMSLRDTSSSSHYRIPEQ